MPSTEQLQIRLRWRFKLFFDLMLNFADSFDHFFVLLADFHQKVDKSNSFQVGILRLNYVLNR